MTQPELGRSSGSKTKARPRWLRALGDGSPPASIVIAGEPHALKEVFKHDSWAATSLYESTDGVFRVVKLHRQSALLILPMAWLGRTTARNERILLTKLQGLPGIPRLTGPVEIDGKEAPFGVAREYVAGHPLGSRELVSDRFFPALRQLLQGMHERRVVYVDLHKRENIIVGQRGEPFLIDFQISLCWPSWLPKGFLFRIFSQSDDYHLMKHWARCRPDQCEVESTAISQSVPWWIRVHRMVARPFRELRRRLLVRVGVRDGKGRVETEVFAEHALRDIRIPHDRAA